MAMNVLGLLVLGGVMVGLAIRIADAFSVGDFEKAAAQTVILAAGLVILVILVARNMSARRRSDGSGSR